MAVTSPLGAGSSSSVDEDAGPPTPGHLQKPNRSTPAKAPLGAASTVHQNKKIPLGGLSGHEWPLEQRSGWDISARDTPGTDAALKAKTTREGRTAVPRPASCPLEAAVVLGTNWRWAGSSLQGLQQGGRYLHSRTQHHPTESIPGRAVTLEAPLGRSQVWRRRR